MTDAEQAAFLTRLLPPAPPRAVEAALGEAAAPVKAKERLDLGSYRLVSIEAAECVMQRAADRHMSLDELFSDRRFAERGGLAFVIDARRLDEIARLFELHSVFPVAATADTGALHMQFLLVGQGRLVVGYDHRGEIEHAEPAYHMYGGRYDLQPLIRMDINGGNPRGFANILALARLDAGVAYEDLIGPKGAHLHGITMSPDGAVVHASLPRWLFGIGKELRIDPPAIARRRPLDPARAAALRDRGCPVDGPWTAGTTPGTAAATMAR